MNQKLFEANYREEAEKIYREKWQTRETARILSEKYGEKITHQNITRAGISTSEYFKDLAERNNTNPKNIKYSWAKDETDSALIYNPLFKEFEKNLCEKFDEICSKYKDWKTIEIKTKKETSRKMCKVVVSDSHVWLNPNPNNNGLFQYEYNGDIYREKFLWILPNIVKESSIHGKFDELVLLDLWDREDWFWGYTTRGGHELEQNMTDGEVFETIVDAKMDLIFNLLKKDIANKIILRDVVNSNHSSSFAYIASIAIKKLVQAVFWDKIEVDILWAYMEHREYGEHTFIYTHGKDSKYQFKGLPLHLNDKATNFINEYIDHYEIQSNHIHVLKWDLHQIGYNKTRKFDYRNFPSFAPWSNWQQHNFWDSYSWYSIQIYEEGSADYAHTDYYINYKRK